MKPVSLGGSCPPCPIARYGYLKVENEIHYNTLELKGRLTNTEWSGIDQWCLMATDEEARETKTRLNRKFQSLMDSPPEQPEQTPHRLRVVKNLSSRILTNTEEQVLSLGLNYAITPARIPYNNIIAATEATAKQLDHNQARELRQNVSQALKNAKLPERNLNGRMLKAIKDLQRSDNIVILPADKGNATVVMDRTQYVEKMENMLKDQTYRKLKGDPTSKVENKIRKT